MASLFITDAEVHALADRLARARGLTTIDAVRLALRRELERGGDGARPPLRERMLDFWTRYPLPDELGPVAEKPFFDDLSGEL